MADVNANIGVNIDTSNALAQLKALQRQISQFHTSISKSSEAAALAQRDLQRNFINSVNSIGTFSAELRTVKTTAESFTDSLEKNKFSMREYFRYAGGATKTFSRLFKSEFDTVNKVAEENVKRLQTQYIKMGRDASGAMRAIAIIPNELDMSSMSTQLQMSAQRQAIFNQLLKQGSTNLLNFGKNTQWAGRQLMVGFTLPLASLGAIASKTFMDMETAALKFRKVYGDLFTPAAEREQALADITALGESFTKYGIAVSQTVNLAAEAAAAGFQGLDLQRQVTEATRLQVLGQVDQQKALETTISLQNAFQLSSADLADSINFLNAVENQTVVSLDDITTAIPKAAPVVKQLGGDVRDLAFFMAAMKEGGINASEGANALKSGLASLINPTDKATAMMKSFGIDIDAIVNKNAGNVKQTVIEFAQALDGLSDLNRQRAIEQLFGKFQLARLSTLFENVTKEGNQASRVLDLATASAGDLASMAESELGMTADSAMNKFRKSVEDLKLALVPVGQTFLESMTPIVEFVGNILQKFNDLPQGVKRAITVMTVALGAIGPVALITFGLFANGLANLIKFVAILRNGYLRLTGQSQVLGEQTQYLTMEQQNALAVAHSLDQSHAKLIQTFTVEAGAVQRLSQAYERAIAAGANFARINPGMMKNPKLPGFKNGIISVPGSGTEDKYPAMLAAGEAVIPARQNKKYSSLIQGIIADNIPGFKRGSTGKFKAVDVPGGYDVSHFGGSSSRTGAELLAMVEGLDTTFAKNIRKMVGSFSDGLSKVFTTFDNRVVAQFTDVNRMMDKQGFADIKTVRENLTGKGFAEVRDLELQDELVRAGMSIDDFKKVNQQITTEIIKGFDALGDKTEITSDELDSLLRKAYDEVAKTDSRIQAAQERMKRVATVTDPRTSSRIPIDKSSYTLKRKSGTYAGGMEAIAPGQNVYPPLSRFGIKSGAAEALGLSLDDAAKVYNQFSKEVKVKLSLLRNDITKFAAEFQREAELAGLKTGNAYKTGIDKSTIADPYVASRQRQSPHPLAAKDGKDDGNAYETARQSAIRKRRAASSPGGEVGPGGVINPPVIPPVGGGGPEGPMFGPRRPTLFDRTVGRARGRIGGVASRFGRGGFAGAGFAASMAVSAGAMMPGKVGELSQKAMPAIFGLQALQMALKLPIPHLKAFAAVALAGVGIFKLINAQREKERLAIEGLGNAANISAEKMKGLGDFFGVMPTKSALAAELPQVAVSAPQRAQIEQFRASDAAKNLAPEIKSLTEATVKEAELALKSLAIKLKGSGFAEDQVNTIISFLQEEAGKTDLKIDLKSLDLNTEAGMTELSNTTRALAENIGKEFATGYSEKVMSAQSRATGEIVTWTEKTMSKGLKKSVSTAAQSLTGIIDGLRGQLDLGIINAEQFAAAFDQISKNIESMPAPQALLLTDKIFEVLPKKLGAAASGLGKVSDRMLILEAKALGVTANLMGVVAAMKILDGGAAYGPEGVLQIRAAEKTLADFEVALADARKKWEKLASSVTGTDGGGAGGGDGEKSVFQKAIEQLKQQQKELANTSAAYNKLKAAGVETSRAFEIASDPILAAAIATTKVGSDKWYELLDILDKVNAALAKEELKKFFETRTEQDQLFKSFMNIVPKLKELGLDAEEMRKILSDPNLAKEFIKDLKDGALDSKRLKTYIEQIPTEKNVNILIDMETKTIEEKFEEAFRKAMDYFDNEIAKKKIELEASLNIKGKKEAVDAAQKAVDDIQEEIDGVNRQLTLARRDVELNFDRPMEALQEEISDLQRQMEITIERPIENLNKEIARLERSIEEQFNRPIAALQEESSDLANDLTLIDKAAEAVNEKYDAQEKALQKISDINQEILNQDKSRLSVADALSRGDIAAAAQAAQEARAQAAQAAAQRAGGVLQAAREAELGGLRGAVSGLTRKQIEQRQFDIGQQIFALEERRDVVQAQIQVKQDEIFKLEQLKLPILDKIREKEDLIYSLQEKKEEFLLNTIRPLEDRLWQLENVDLYEANKKLKAAQKALQDAENTINQEVEKINQQKEAWEKAKVAIEAAKLEAEGIKKAVEGTTLELVNVAAGWAAVEAAAKKAATAMSGTKPVVPTLKNPYGGSDADYDRSIGFNRNTSVFTGKMYGGKIKKMAMGGIVGGSGMTDKVPTMLTPGEFVVNKQATKKFGPLLSAINGTKYPQMLAKGGMVGGSGSFSSPSFGSLRNNLSAPSYSSGSRPMPSMSRPGSAPIISDNSNTVYNYNVGITLSGTSMNPNTVAKAVMDEIRYVDSQRIRGQRA